MNIRHDCEDGAHCFEFDGTPEEFAWLCEFCPQAVQGLLEGLLQSGMSEEVRETT